ncbi:DUF4177 domain-containing protein [Luteolibacter flavescens]|uniref:DUF4177 domain-containing protein n=1 Tax=Luteolibacter flavescens TaxID=1859460 RepID=A0ABT3FQW4_9BACT|nr:DUF4177 domain-containing protein [Luteolibacter flavescens]MCW1885973.1 DUF4177 domain-containing protein [Luteolibacter flavescens]
MKEYKTSQWPIRGGQVDTDKFDQYLNDMQKAGWELFSTSAIHVWRGEGNVVLCVFVRETTGLSP